MTTREDAVDIVTADGHARSVLYTSADGTPRPGVIYLTDIAGIRPAARAAAARVADAGFAVLLPNIFYRSGEPPFLSHPIDGTKDETRRIIESLRLSLPPDAIARDADAYVTFLRAQAAVSAAPLGVVGYCFSGAMALRIAAAQPDQIGAAASFHGGGLATDAPSSPHLLLPRVKARLYFGHAVEDRGMPPEAIETLARALRAWGGIAESEVYDGARHGWTTTDHPVHNAPQAERAFAKLIELLRAGTTR
jgi:carboxymethylenebutenolidase